MTLAYSWKTPKSQETETRTMRVCMAAAMTAVQ